MAMEYITEPMDSLPSIAEAFGHSGEWLELAQENPDLPDFHNIQPGMSILIPPEWIQEQAPADTTSSTTKTTTTTGKSGSVSSSDTGNVSSSHTSSHSGSTPGSG
jgi:hypothetical protein